MTWLGPGIETDLSSSKSRPVVVVDCDADGCDRWEAVGHHDGDVVKIQKLLMRRGWVWTDVADGARDLCPEHAS